MKAKIDEFLDTDDIEMVRFVLGIYNTKDEKEDEKIKKLYAKFCNLSDIA